MDLGEGDVQVFEKLEAGKTIWVSPMAQNLVTVNVTSKERIQVFKGFRESMSMVVFGLS